MLAAALALSTILLTERALAMDMFLIFSYDLFLLLKVASGFRCFAAAAGQSDFGDDICIKSLGVTFFLGFVREVIDLAVASE